MARTDRKQKGKDVFRRPGRHIEPTRPVLIICEGETEEKYLEHVLQPLKKLNPLVTITVISLGEAGDARLLLAKARRKYKPSEDTSIWLVYDCEPHDPGRNKIGRDLYSYLGGHPCPENLNRRYHPIVSFPSFEIWLLLHHENAWKVQNPKEAKKALKTAFPNCCLPAGPFTCFDPHRQAAIDRATTLWVKASLEAFPSNCCSSVFILIKHLIQLSCPPYQELKRRVKPSPQ